MSKSKILIIVESPAKCEKIEGFLGHNYKCIASYGHIRELKKDNTAYDENNNYKPNFQLIEARKEYLDNIKPIIKKHEEILIATDDDREGEAIAWHICKVFKLSIKNTKRLIFNSITRDAILSALRKPQKINMSIVYAQRTRQILDQMLGFSVTPILWKHVSHTAKLSAGRCQTPALRLIYDRYLSIKNAEDTITYGIQGQFINNFIFTYDKVFENHMDVKNFLSNSKTFKHILSVGKEKKGKYSPPKPLTTSVLQQRASNELNMSPAQTMRSAQILYEEGFITYMRTDSMKYSKEFVTNANIYILKIYGLEYLKKCYHEIYKNYKFDNPTAVVNIDQDNDNFDKKTTLVQGAHEAIRPTKIKKATLVENSKIKNSEIRLYKLIYNTALESCMSDCLVLKTNTRINSPIKDCYYKYTFEKIVSPGWKVVKGYNNNAIDYDNIVKIKKLVVNYNKIFSKADIRNAKTRYTEASLVRALEKQGIGRPSTFSSLVGKIQEREYVKKENVEGKEYDITNYNLTNNTLETETCKKVFGAEKNKLVIQSKGILIMEFLLEHFKHLFEYSFTKQMEDNLDLITKNKVVWYDICDEYNNNIKKYTDRIHDKFKLKYEIDEKHTFIMGKHGPIVKYQDNGVTKFLGVKKNIDIDKIKKGLCTLNDIVHRPKESLADNQKNLGIYLDDIIYVKSGRYGPYLSFKKKNYSLKKIEKSAESITLEEAIKIIEKKYIGGNYLKILTKEASIRKGKYGPYIYYKTKSMKKPKFIKIPKNMDWEDIEMKWVIEQLEK